MSRFFSLAESCGASMISFIRCSASYIGGRIKKFCHQRLLWNPKAIMLLFCYVNVWPAFLSRLMQICCLYNASIEFGRSFIQMLIWLWYGAYKGAHTILHLHSIYTWYSNKAFPWACEGCEGLLRPCTFFSLTFQIDSIFCWWKRECWRWRTRWETNDVCDRPFSE
jgi:hypothetical protein